MSVMPSPLRRILLTISSVLLLWVGLAVPSQAHWADLAVAEIVVNQRDSQIVLTFPTGWVEWADDNRDSELSAAEIRTHRSELRSFFGDKIRLTNREERPGALTVAPAATKPLPSTSPSVVGTHTTLQLVYTWPQPIQALAIRYDLFFPNISTASCLATIRQDGQVQTVVFTPENREFSLQPSVWQPIRSFLWLGIAHILTGYDHILFLIGLLMLGGRLPYLIKIVTAFTVAHSATLSLAVLDVVSLPARWVESAIALTIVYVAMENLWRKSLKGRWQLTFGFGLIHGLGFANILRELDISRSHLALSLASFNLGVEIGQIAVVTLTFLALQAIRNASWALYFRRWISVGIGAIGLFWFVQRVAIAA